MCIWCGSSCPNGGNEDTSLGVSSVFPVVLMLVIRIPVYVYLVCFTLS